MSVKSVIATVVCLVSLAYPLVSSASYVIKLRNGRQFVTPHYWKQNHNIMFYIHGGIAGVIDSSIMDIHEDHSQNWEIIYVKEENVTLNISNIKNETDIRKQIDFEEYRKNKELIKSQIDTALERYREASNSKRNEEKEQAQQEITELSKKIFALTDDLKQKNNGSLPEWWDKF